MRRRRRRRRVARMKKETVCREMLSCLYLTRARSKPTPEPGGPPPVALRPCVFRRPNVRARYSRRRGGKAPRAPKNQSASRRPADSPSDPPLFPIAFSRSLLELAVQGVLAEVRVVLHELQALGGVAAVLRASERREGRIRRTASVSRFFFRLQTGARRRRRRRLRTRRRRRLETRERKFETRQRCLLSRVVVDGFASRARALSMTRRVAVEPFKDEKARRKTKALSIGFRVTRSPTMPICALLYPPGVGRCAARERLGDAKLPGTRSRTFWDM